MVKANPEKTYRDAVAAYHESKIRMKKRKSESSSSTTVTLGISSKTMTINLWMMRLNAGNIKRVLKDIINMKTAI